MNNCLRILCAVLGVVCFAGAAWLTMAPLGEFNGLAVTFLAGAGVVGLYGGMRG